MKTDRKGINWHLLLVQGPAGSLGPSVAFSCYAACLAKNGPENPASSRLAAKYSLGGNLDAVLEIAAAGF